MNKKNDKKIGLALSGGGVIGFAHIGVLKELEKNDIKISAICGTSAGALMGVLFASGGTEKIEAFIAYLDGAGMFKKKYFYPNTGFNIVRTALEKYLGATDFKDLKIPFSCVATDIETAEMVVLESGNVVDAVMASCAYPGIFDPQKINDRVLVDGGIVKNMPAVLLKNKTDFIIGSSLHDISHIKRGSLENFFGYKRIAIMSRAIDIMQAELTKIDLECCDYVFSPPEVDFQWFQFNEMEKVKKIGEDNANAKIAELLKILG